MRQEGRSVYSRVTHRASTGRSERDKGDPRYQTPDWRKLSKAVRRQRPYCYVPGCERGAEVTDHIIPVTRDMPNSLFYDPRNLRPSCRMHNNARGRVTHAVRALGLADVTFLAERAALGEGSAKTARFSTERRSNDVRLAGISPLPRKPPAA